MDDYASYSLVNSNGVVVPGHKASFCLIDGEQWDTGANTNAIFDFDNQGTQSGWADTYKSPSLCQWIDITDVPPGKFAVELEVNPERIIVESNTTNNVVAIELTISSCHQIQMGPTSFDDSINGNANGFLDPGELIQSTVHLENYGCLVPNVTAHLSSSTDGISILQSESIFPDPQSGTASSNSLPYQFKINKTIGWGTPIQFTLLTSDDHEQITFCTL